MKRLIAPVLALVMLAAACGQAAAPAPAPAQPAASSGAQPPVQPQQLKPVKLAISVSTLVFAPIDVAVNQGFFKQEGLDPQFVDLSGGNEVVAALQSGSVDFAAGAGGSLILAASKGVSDVICVANLIGKNTIEAGMRTALADKLKMSPSMPLDQRLKLLKGLTVGTTSAGSASDQLMKLAEATVGLNPSKDVKTVAVGQASALLAALKQGQVDVIDISPPVVEQAEADGSGKLFFRASELPGLGDIVHDGLFASKKMVQQNPDLILKVMRAIDKGEQYLQSNTDQAIAGLEKNQYKKTPPALVSASIKGMLPAWPAHLGMAGTTWQNTLDLVKKTGELKGSAPDLKALWTDQFIKQLGG